MKDSIKFLILYFSILQKPLLKPNSKSSKKLKTSAYYLKCLSKENHLKLKLQSVLDMSF